MVDYQINKFILLALLLMCYLLPRMVRDKNNCLNSCLISLSLLSCSSKVLEKVVFNRLYDYFEANYLISILVTGVQEKTTAL